MVHDYIAVIGHGDVWAIVTVITYMIIGFDAVFSARKLPWNQGKIMFVAFVVVFVLCALTGYMPMAFPNWPKELSETTHHMLPVVAIMFLLGGGFRAVIGPHVVPVEVRPSLEDEWREILRKIDSNVPPPHRQGGRDQGELDLGPDPHPILDEPETTRPSQIDPN